MGTLLEQDSPTFLEEDSPSEGAIVEDADEFANYQTVPRFVQIKENVYMHLEPFEVMSYVTLTDHCGSHATPSKTFKSSVRGPHGICLKGLWFSMQT